LRSVGISFLQLPLIARDFRRELNKKIELLKPVEGIAGVISHLHLRKCVVGILTSNSSKNVASFLNRNSMREMFHFVQPQRSLFNKSKTLKSIVKSYRFRSDQVLYIGDETRDIEAAKKCNILVASVCWGLNTKKVLMTHKPDYLIESPSRLLDLVSNQLK
jgi:phosphoglycolate phosphatase-like HAD superfamily hydrolase